MCFARSNLTSLIPFDYSWFSFSINPLCSSPPTAFTSTTSINSPAAGRFAATFICQHCTLSNFFFYFFFLLVFSDLLISAGRLLSRVFLCFFFFFFLVSQPDWFNSSLKGNSAWKSFSTQVSRVVWVFVGKFMWYASAQEKQKKRWKRFFSRLLNSLLRKSCSTPSWVSRFLHWLQDDFGSTAYFLFLSFFVLTPCFSFHFSSCFFLVCCAECRPLLFLN